ncbi:hypothetical protein O4H66_27180 [Comamonadaceae bacterium G21597-S1]|nr:hypothetical protein [Comamonadaceae bacterium G21597-S1]
MTIRATRLHLQAHQTTLKTAQGRNIILSVGALSLADGFFHRDPPKPHELEHAIDAVEDALMADHVPRAIGGSLVSSDPALHALPGLQTSGTTLSIDQIEAPFQQLAAASLGRPGHMTDLQQGRQAAAALLILRECMHHLNFESASFIDY